MNISDIVKKYRKKDPIKLNINDITTMILPTIAYADVEYHFGYNMCGFKELINYNNTLRNYSDEQMHNEILINNSKMQFSKGINRLKTWMFLAYNTPSVLWNEFAHTFTSFDIMDELNKEQRAYICSALIIYFQVFGDGNHRTAYKYFQHITGRELSLNEKYCIYTIREDYHHILAEDCPTYNLYSIINILLSSFPDY
jgi:hypothetical protein